MAKTDIAYMAGLFDGEGCIHIARIHTQKRSLTFQLVCKVSMYSLPTLEIFKAGFGGSIRRESSDEKHNKYGLLHSWAIWSKGSVPKKQLGQVRASGGIGIKRRRL